MPSKCIQMLFSVGLVQVSRLCYIVHSVLPCRTMISKFGYICYLVAASFTSGAASNTSCWSLTAGQCGPFTTAQCLIWTASHKTPGSATQCHLNQDWLELSLAFAFPPSSPPAFFPGRFMNNEWGYMQAGAQILMEQKKRRRTILCAASHCFPTPAEAARPLFSPSLFLPSAACGPRWDNARSLFLSCLKIFRFSPGCHSRGQGWSGTLKWEGLTFKL